MVDLQYHYEEAVKERGSYGHKMATLVTQDALQSSVRRVFYLTLTASSESVVPSKRLMALCLE